MKIEPVTVVDPTDAIALVREARALVFALEEEAYRAYIPVRSRRLGYVITRATTRLRRRIESAAQAIKQEHG